MGCDVTSRLPLLCCPFINSSGYKKNQQTKKIPTKHLCNCNTLFNISTFWFASSSSGLVLVWSLNTSLLPKPVTTIQKDNLVQYKSQNVYSILSEGELRWELKEIPRLHRKMQIPSTAMTTILSCPLLRACALHLFKN